MKILNSKEMLFEEECVEYFSEEEYIVSKNNKKNKKYLYIIQ